jgi:hypothetical protein
MITIWVDVINNIIIQEDCLLSQTDSTTANGWLRESNFSDSGDKVAQLTTAHQLAKLVINSKSCLCSQWFAGVENIVSDALSHDFHLPDKILIHLIYCKVPHQVPFGLKIFQLPLKISSWLTCMLRNLPSKEQWSKEPMQSNLLLGFATENISRPLDYPMTVSLMNFHLARNNASTVHSLTPSEKVDLVLQEIVKPTNPSQSEPPWIVWHRPTNWQKRQILYLMPINNLHSFYNVNSKAIISQINL